MCMYRCTHVFIFSYIHTYMYMYTRVSQSGVLDSNIFRDQRQMLLTYLDCLSPLFESRVLDPEQSPINVCIHIHV